MLSLSDNDVPERHRLAFLHDFVARSVAGLQFTPRGDDRFRFEMHCRKLRGLTVVGSARYSGVRGERTRELTADGRQNYMLTVHDKFSPHNREYGEPPAGAILRRGVAPWRTTCPPDFRPRNAVA